MSKEKTINYIKTIVNFCINDGNTYLYAKCTPTAKKDKEKFSLGGGNFTILLSTLATIEFLGQIDAIIDGKTKKERNSLGKTFKNFIENTEKIIGIDKKDGERIWKIRNKLAHEFTPKIAAAIGMPFGVETDFENLFLNYHKFPIFDGHSDRINSNVLNQRLKFLLEYILKKIDNCDDVKIKKIEKYIGKIE